MADERSTSPVFGDAGGTSPRDDDESTEEAAGAKRAAPAGGRAQSKKRGTTKTLRIGIIAGKVDDDCCIAPGIPESHWVSEAAARRVAFSATAAWSASMASCSVRSAAALCARRRVGAPWAPG